MLTDELIVQVAKGDYKVFERVHEELVGSVYYFVMKLVGDRDLSWDFVQDAFVLYWEKRKDFSSVLAVKAFLYMVVRNKIMKYKHTEENRRRILDKLVWDTVYEDETLLHAEICAEVTRAIADLPPRTRQIIELSMQDMTVHEIAESLSISSNTVKSLKKAGYKILCEQLKHLRVLLIFLFA